MIADVPSPNGCAACGVDPRGHFQRWDAASGWHRWREPTNELRLARMRERRAQRDLVHPSSRYCDCGASEPLRKLYNGWLQCDPCRSVFDPSRWTTGSA